MSANPEAGGLTRLVHDAFLQMGEAELTMDLRRATGMPVLECRAAVRHSSERAEQIAYLRARYREKMPKGSWLFPDELRDD